MGGSVQLKRPRFFGKVGFLVDIMMTGVGVGIAKFGALPPFTPSGCHVVAV